MDNKNFESEEQCVQYVQSIKAVDNILSSTDRALLFKARQHFINNLDNFSDQNIDYLLNNIHFKQFTNLQVNDLINNCNQKDKELPVFLKQCNSCESHVLVPYLTRVAKKHPEQLKFFFDLKDEKDPENIKKKSILTQIFNESNIRNDWLIQLVTSYDPVSILNSKLPTEKIVQWIENNSQHATALAKHIAMGYDGEELIKEKIHEKLILEKIKDKHNILNSSINLDLLILLTDLDSKFIEKFKELDSDFLTSIMQKPILLDNNEKQGVFAIPIVHLLNSQKLTNKTKEKENNQITVNVAQHIYLYHTENYNIEKAQSIVSLFKQEVLKPINIEYNLYEYKENPIEYFFKNKFEENFTIGLKEEFASLNKEEQKIYVATCVQSLKEKNSVSLLTKNLTHILEVVPHELTNLYLSKAIDYFNSDVASYVCSFILKNKLNNQLPEDKKSLTRKKI